MAKKVSTKKGLAPKPATDLATIKEQLAAEADDIANRVNAPTGNKISTYGGTFTLPGKEPDEGPIRMVIVDFLSRNNYYDPNIRFNIDDPQPPICWAINKHPAALAPSKNAPDIQSDTDCAECPMNQFGSDGNGKACKNNRLLALLDPMDPTGDIMTLSVSPTALKGFDAYVAKVSNLFGVPPVGVITEIGLKPEGTYSKLIFGNPVPNENIETFFARRADAEAVLTAEPTPQEDEPEVKPKPQRVAKKKVAKKRVARR